MSPPIGFVILSHNLPDLVLRLVGTLNAMFGDPPIVCHHDSSASFIDESRFPRNVRFVHPHVVTRWGDISVSIAAMRAFEMLRTHAHPKWFVLLSASDYPVRPAAEILDELTNSEYDVYLDHREIQYRVIPPGQTAQDGGFRRPGYIAVAYDRYFACRFRLPFPSKRKLLAGKFPIRMRQGFVTRNPTFNRAVQRLRLGHPIRIFAGDFWFQANRTAIDRLLDDPSTPRLVRYYRLCPNADESIFHTIFCNQPDLRICADNKRYAEWPPAASHPTLLGVSDVPTIIASGAHFARKFGPDEDVRTFIDRTVLRMPVAQ